jgi:hypothetical protein
MASVTVTEGATTLGTPASGDSLFILGGNATITTNVDQSALAAGLVREEISRAYTGQYASAGAPHKVQISTARVYMAISGDMYYQAAGNGGNTAALIQVIAGGHFHFVAGGTATRFEVIAGQATISAPCVVTSLRIAGGSTTLLDDSSTDPTLIELMAGPAGTGGTCYTERGGTTFTNGCGTLTIKAASNTLTTLNCQGSPLTAKTVLVTSGTITTVNATGHIPDTTQLVQPVTITNTPINMGLPGAQAFLDHPLITFTNTPTRYITDGRLV